MAHRLLQDPDADGWERSDFPIVCETCLGPNPYVRMQRIEFGGTCHISGRPYTVFRWRPGNDARYKKTIICQEVAKAKNVCQVCLFDLDYGLPVQVRDTALGIEKEDIPESEVGKEFQLNEQIQRGQMESSFGGSRPNDMLMQLQRTSPYYKRNQARICSFFVKGQCNRGAECPYRHEMPEQNELSEQNIKDRYYGINDPVANKILRRFGDQPKLEPPEDQTITSLYVGGVTPEISEEDLRDVFYTHGELAAVRKVASRFCAFVTYTERAAAEKAAEALHNKLVVKGVRLRLMWGRQQGGRPPQQQHDPMQPIQSGGSGAASAGAAGGSSGAAAAAAAAAAAEGNNYFGLAPGAAYPSMDPTAMGARIPAKRTGPGDADDAGKRQRMDGAPGSSGYGHMPPPPHPGMPPPLPPPGFMMPPHQGMVMARPGMMGPSPGMAPPRPMMPARPPPGAPPPAAAVAAAGGSAVPPPVPPAGAPPAQQAAAAAPAPSTAAEGQG